MHKRWRISLKKREKGKKMRLAIPVGEEKEVTLWKE